MQDKEGVEEWQMEKSVREEKDDVFKRRLKRALQESWGDWRCREAEGREELQNWGRLGKMTRRDVTASLPKWSISNIRRQWSSKKQRGLGKTQSPQQEIRWQKTISILSEWLEANYLRGQPDLTSERMVLKVACLRPSWEPCLPELTGCLYQGTLPLKLWCVPCMSLSPLLF